MTRPATTPGDPMTTDPATLAREVLAIQDRHRALNARTGLDLPIDINDMETLASAAPILARQIEDVERVLADAEEWIGPVARNDYDEGMAELIDRILRALTDTAHYWSEPPQGGPDV